MLRPGFFLIALTLVSLWSRAQRPLLDADRQVAGYLFSVNSMAPCCVVLPQPGVDLTDRYELAVRLNKLGMNALVVPDSPCYEDQQDDFAAACEDLRRRIDILRREGGAPVLVMGARRSASIALVAATRDLRIKAVLAVSPGEYFGEGHGVEERLVSLRAPTQVVCTKSEQVVAKQILRGVPKALLFVSSSLQGSGYSDLLTSDLASGESWLAISIFLNDQFELRPWGKGLRR